MVTVVHGKSEEGLNQGSAGGNSRAIKKTPDGRELV